MSTPVSLFDFELPKELIALYPASMRDKCRLMVLDNTHKQELIEHKVFSDLIDLIDRDSFLVINNTKVRNARLSASKVTGGKSEIFVTNVLSHNHFEGLVKGRFKEGDSILSSGYKFKLISKKEDGVWLIESEEDIENIMDEVGHVPLPPYISRADTEKDKVDYQTVYAKEIGSSAAPTAGLHFTKELIENLKNHGVEVLELTLDVGLGTFRPVKSEFMEDHVMHSERYEISDDVASKINSLKSQGKKLIAVGSTSVRTLETAANENGEIIPGIDHSKIFITPGYKFKVVDNMITNFHLPKSTLLAMVAALGGYDYIMKAYKEAVQNGYHFFSYGDAMFIKNK